ncbi:Xanthine dehydrogenase iron-sulfur subunit (EC [Streptomyces globisporus]|uniref:Xanthine dehydrogenase iron-sulfur subunit (EC) n=1 Tax=Streptomyces globisporus TaxID=1908 RepID=A0ABM9GXT1_STRGL|nr:2Fe-2S iron-sulfur cluster-binding protein [Streptomyces globisporus]CAH9415528.1 Xanthine dehydrogenase iron-sulfur subunit (EC [Streptomyces globisporus]
MSNEENPHQRYGQQGQGHSEDPDPRYGGWEPTPQGDGFDADATAADATAFVHLPPEDLANIPLAAPGHGYVPPMIVPLTPAAGLDPAATGSWVIQTQAQQAQAEQRAEEAAAAYEAAAQETGAIQWPDPNQQGGVPSGYQGPYQDTSHSTAQWNFTEALGETAPAPETAGEPDATAHTGHSGHTGQWTIPVADGDLPDESGEFLASAHTHQWYTDSARPATLPGGAPAPWATPEPEAAPVPAPEETPEGEPAAESPAEAPEAEPDAEANASEAGEAEPDGEAETEAPSDTDLTTTEAAAPTDGTLAPTDEAPADQASALPDVPSEHPAASYLLHVNGMDRPVSDAWIGESLLYVLRERLGLAGAKDGCSQGECGACNVQVDGRLVASCLVPAATAAGSEVRTVEGLAVDGEPSDVQRALSACGAVQCGFCIPGMAMTVHDLLEGNHAPSELETRAALCGNLCRCSGYRGVLDAVADVVAAREANAEAAAPDEARIPHQAEPGAGGVQQGSHPHEGEAL